MATIPIGMIRYARMARLNTGEAVLDVEELDSGLDDEPEASTKPLDSGEVR